MSQFNTILDGKLEADYAANESSYNYTGYTAVDGSWVIKRVKTDNTETRYKLGNSDYDWSDRANGNYKRQDQFSFNRI